MGLNVVAFGESHSLDNGRFVPVEAAKDLYLEVREKENIDYLPGMIGSMLDQPDPSFPLPHYLNPDENNALAVFIIAHAINILSDFESKFAEQDAVAVFTFYRVKIENQKAYMPVFVSFLEPKYFDSTNPVLPPEAWSNWYRKHSTEQLNMYDKNSIAWKRVEFVKNLHNLSDVLT